MYVCIYLHIYITYVNVHTRTQAATQQQRILLPSSSEEERVRESTEHQRLRKISDFSDYSTSEYYYFLLMNDSYTNTHPYTPTH